MLKFFKYHGAGNDFIMIDNRHQSFNIDNQFIKNICNRRMGIGADGLILINRPTEQNVDFNMQYFNADGFEGTMCGNGGRCAVAFAHSLGIIKEHATFLGCDGKHHANIISTNKNILRINLQMINVENILPYQDGYFLNTGSPHVVLFKNNVKDLNVYKLGRKIRYDSFFANGTNVNFVESIGPNELFVRTFERGVEDETLSCGTGVTASALALAFAKNINAPIHIKTFGGNFSVNFAQENKIFTNVWLKGDTCFVFSGEINF